MQICLKLHELHCPGAVFSEHINKGQVCLVTYLYSYIYLGAKCNIYS